MREITSTEMYAWGYSVLGQLTILLMVITGDLFLLVFAGFYLLLYILHMWMAQKGIEMRFFFDRKKREIQAKYDEVRLTALIRELKEIQKILKNKKR